MSILDPTLTVPFVDLSVQYRALQEEITEAISRVMRDADFILGRDVALFEEEFAEFCGAQYAVGVDSGISALEFALRAYGIGPGDEVITVANTFVATAFSISHSGATPVLVDADPVTYNLDPGLVQQAITHRTKALMPVHLYGQTADMDPLIEIAQHHNLVVIEDACQAHGARYKGRRSGTLGHAAAFSFYPGKNLGAYGDGGILVTNDRAVAEYAKISRNYGQREKYHHVQIGYNRRLDTLQAAILRIKLRYLDEWNGARRRHAEMYNRLLAGTTAVTPVEAPYAESVWHLYVIRVADRDGLKAHLADRHISAGVHYPVPVHLQPVYKHLGYKQGDFPTSEKYAGQVLSLPMYPELTEGQIEYLVRAIRDFG